MRWRCVWNATYRRPFSNTLPKPKTMASRKAFHDADIPRTNRDPGGGAKIFRTTACVATKHSSLEWRSRAAGAHDETVNVDRQVRCVHCHWMVGHGEKTGLGGPLRRQEIESLEAGPVPLPPKP